MGLLLYRSPIFPQEHELIWELPRDVGLQDCEIQLWSGSTLLKREQRSFTNSPQSDWIQTLPLKPGEYQAEVFVHLDGGVARHEHRTFRVDGAAPVRLPLLAR